MIYLFENSRWLPVSVFTLVFLWFSPLLQASIWESQLALANKLGKPVLAVASGESCPPCLALKHTLRTDENIRAVLERFVLLEMDVKSLEFAQFSARFPHRLQAIPIVFMLRPDGKVLYGRSGGMLADALVRLLASGLESSGCGLTEEQAEEISQRVEQARGLYQAGDLVNAYRHVAATSELRSYAGPVCQATQLRRQLATELIQRKSSLEAGFTQVGNQFTTALVIYELYISASADVELQQVLAQILSVKETCPTTRTAVLQAKHSVRARHHELNGQRQAAQTSYQLVVDLDPNSPAAHQAGSRLRMMGVKQLLARDNGVVTEPFWGRGANGVPRQPPRNLESVSSTVNSAGANGRQQVKLAAEDYLRLAVFYKYRHPNIAADYARQALEAANRAETATAARHLLDQL